MKKLAILYPLIIIVNLKSLAQIPNPRHLEEVTYDACRDRLILYGGSQYQNSKWDEPSFVSEWNGKEWKQIEAAGAGNRRAHALVYDPNQKIVVAFGGVKENSEKKNVELFDVWDWNGQIWKKVSDKCPVREPEVAYDVSNKRTLVYGHTGDYSSFELWAIQNNVWERLSNKGPKPDGPYEVIYHLARQSFMVPTSVDGNIVLNEWKDNQWKEVPRLGNCPTGRNRYAMAYHEKENALYLFGGRNAEHSFLNDFWKWDGFKWKQVNSKVTPLERAAHLLEYANGKLILYGGTVQHPEKKEKAGISNELWYFENSNWQKMSGGWLELQ